MKSLNSQKLRIKLTKKRQKKEDEEEEEYLVDEKEGEEGLEGVHGEIENDSDGTQMGFLPIVTSEEISTTEIGADKDSIIPKNF